MAVLEMITLPHIQWNLTKYAKQRGLVHTCSTREVPLVRTSLGYKRPCLKTSKRRVCGEVAEGAQAHVSALSTKNEHFGTFRYFYPRNKSICNLGTDLMGEGRQ